MTIIPAHHLLPGQSFVDVGCAESNEHVEPCVVDGVTTLRANGRTITDLTIDRGVVHTTKSYPAGSDVIVVPAKPVMHAAFIPSEGKWYASVEYTGPLALDLNEATLWDGDTEDDAGLPAVELGSVVALPANRAELDRIRLLLGKMGDFGDPVVDELVGRVESLLDGRRGTIPGDF